MHTLMQALRQSTHDAHQQLEKLPFSSALQTGILPLTSYFSYLQAMSEVYSVLECELTLSADANIAAVWNDTLRKLPAIERDIAYFAPYHLSSIPAVQLAVQPLVQQLTYHAVNQPQAMLGYLYVLEGSTLGAQILTQWVIRCFGLEIPHGVAFLYGYGDATQAHWQDFSAQMNRLEITHSQKTTIIEAACEAFAGIERIMAALYPLERKTPCTD